MSDMITTDLAEFGHRELKEAGRLLSAYQTDQDNSRTLTDKVHVMFNKNSGYVFLTDEEANVAMMEGEKLEDFLNCPDCGHEGSRTEFLYSEDGKECCVEYFEGHLS